MFYLTTGGIRDQCKFFCVLKAYFMVLSFKKLYNNSFWAEEMDFKFTWTMGTVEGFFGILLEERTLKCHIKRFFVGELLFFIYKVFLHPLSRIEEMLVSNVKNTDFKAFSLSQLRAASIVFHSVKDVY